MIMAISPINRGRAARWVWLADIIEPS